MKVAFLAGHLAGKTTFSPEQHPRLLDAGERKFGSLLFSRFFLLPCHAVHQAFRGR
jgi:hypothetical protein